jgi:hypothetical protein
MPEPSDSFQFFRKEFEMWDKNHTSLLVVLLSAFGTLALSATLHADAFSQHTQATLGDMTSQTEATTPADRTRTTIGIGEKVVCAISPASWVDKDCNETTQTIMDDEIGTRTFSASGGAGVVAPTAAGLHDECTLFASKTAGNVTVGVSVLDSRQKFNDDAVTKSIAFTVIAPDGASTSVTANPGFTAGADRIGVKTTYAVKVLPDTVSFYKISFREHLPNKDVTWPDDTAEIPYGAATDVPYTVNQANIAGDDIQDGLRPKARLDDGTTAPNPHYVNFDIETSWPDQYKNESDEWTTYVYLELKTEYLGNNLKGRHTYQGQSGDWQGPWE